MKVKFHYRCVNCLDDVAIDIRTEGIFKKHAYKYYHNFLCDDCHNEEERKQKEAHKKHIKAILDKEKKCHHEWHVLKNERGSYLKCPKCGKTVW